MQTKRLSVLLDRILNVAFFELNHAEIVVGHPAIWIFRNGCTPERFGVAVGRALSPGQQTEADENREAGAAHDPLPGLARPAQGHETGRSQGDRADAG